MDWTWRDACGGLGCGMGIRGEGYGWDGDRDGLNWWEDNIANIIFGMEINAPLAYDPGLELRHPITITLLGHVHRL